MIPTDRYCPSRPGNGDNSVLSKLSVMPFFFFLFMSDAHHGINSSTQKYQSTQSV